MSAKKRKLTLAAALKAEKMPIMGHAEFCKLGEQIDKLETELMRMKHQWAMAHEWHLRRQYFQRGWIARDVGGGS